MVTSDNYILDLFRQSGVPANKAISAGVLDSHDQRIESVDEVKQGINRALEELPPERLYIEPGCGLKIRGKQEANPSSRS